MIDFRVLIKTAMGSNVFLRFVIIQNYLFLVMLFNFLLNLTPFHFFKKIVCFLFGIRLGKSVTICGGVRFLGLGRCTIGDRTIINRDCLIDNREVLRIGQDVSIATRVMIFTQGHDVNDSKFSLSKKHVEISDHVCIFAGAQIMPGVTLGNGCVVYPGAVVSKSFENNSIVGGTPAKFLKLRRSDLLYKIDSNFWFN